MSFRAEAAERPQSRNRDRPARGEVILSERLCENSDSNAIPEKPSLIHRAGATISIGGMILVSPFSPSVRVFTQSLAQDDNSSTGQTPPTVRRVARPFTGPAVGTRPVGRHHAIHDRSLSSVRPSGGAGVQPGEGSERPVGWRHLVAHGPRARQIAGHATRRGR